MRELVDTVTAVDSRRLGYALMMIAAAATFLLLRRAQRWQSADAGLRWFQKAALLAAGFAGGTLAAKLPFVLVGEPPWYAPGAWFADGKTILTGLLGAYLGIELCKAVLGIHVKTGDAYALPLAGALAVGRWGCFLNGCCFGIPCSLPWAVDFGHGPAHPVQIYESLFHGAMAVLLWQLAGVETLRYQRLKAYLIAYCLFRFLTEWIRPTPVLWSGLTFYQLSALVFSAALVVHWLADERLKRKQRAGLSGNAPVAAQKPILAGPIEADRR